MNQDPKKHDKTFTDFLRRLFDSVLESAARFLLKIGLTPNAITMVGFIGSLAAGVLMAFGHLRWGGIVALILTPLDALDGKMARLQGCEGNYGALIDSVMDRYSEIVIYAGLIFTFISTSSALEVMLVFAALAGSLMVSYVRARAESLGYCAKIGLLTRAERYIVLLPGLIFNFPVLSLWILAILTHFTAFQRFFYVRKHAGDR
jgi:CDP-diacylglycerol---glycerol-3-phosphate 3-phosphatidyltransferase